MKAKKQAYRWGMYLLGLLSLALGITLNTKCGLGVSPIISVAYSAALILKLRVGDTTMVLYAAFVVVELVIHTAHRCKARQYVLDLLQLAFSVVFTRLINVFSVYIPQLDTVYAGRWQGSLPVRLLVLAVAIILTGIGAALSLNMRLVPNPGDGVVQAVADGIGKPVGFTKNCWDILMVVISSGLTLALYSRIAGTPGQAFLSVIGIGTVLAVIGVGRVIALFNRLTYTHMTRRAGVTAPVKTNA